MRGVSRRRFVDAVKFYCGELMEYNMFQLISVVGWLPEGERLTIPNAAAVVNRWGDLHGADQGLRIETFVFL